MSSKALRPAILLGLILLCGCSSTSTHNVTQPEQAGAYYVAADGDDNNRGTIDLPWETLQHAADLAAPGSTIYIREGVYHQKLHITNGGSEDAGPVIFSAYSGETAILDGEGLAVDGLEGLIEINNASYVTIQNLEIRNYQTADNGEVPAGIYVHGSGQSISLLNNRIHSIANTAAPEGEDLSGRDAHGIAVYGTEAEEALSDLTIDGNEVYDLVLGSSEAVAVNGNVDSFAITNNKIHDNDNIGIDIIGFEGTAGDEAVDQARNGMIKGNEVYGISSNHNPSYGASLPNGNYSAGGIYIDGGRSIRVEKNRVYDNDIGIELASEHKGKLTRDITVQDNLVYRNRLTGIAMGGYDEDRGGTSDSKVILNTLYQNDLLEGGGNGQLYLQANLSRNTITDNILVAGESGVLISNDYTSSSENTVDGNLYFAETGADEAIWVWKKQEYAGFSAYQRGTGNDRSSLFADPQFVDASAGDFRLQPDSRIVNGGSAGAKTD
ncbi:right-handed parallel beta-helix repeat-containing protein [Paenibacillus sp. FSL R7-0345]|uniref:right-handed parallel beta-helix repeat-containing protein n=1 Tax=Paenibacillus sp. FSL R7-0345 TaxID=2954535 RepID=UPI00315B1939